MTKTLNLNSVRKPLRNLVFTVVGTAALTLASSASAGAPDDVIAYFLGGGNLTQGRTILKDNKNVKTPVYQAQLYAATIQALTNTADNSAELASLRLKTTPSAVAIYTLKLLPAFTPGISTAGTQAAFSPSSISVWKLKDASVSLKDAQKTAENAIALGLKSYPKGTANSNFLGVVATSSPGSGYKTDLPTAAAQISYAVTYGAIAGSGTATPPSSSAIGALTGSLVKKAASSASRNSLTPGSTVTGLIAQFAGEQQVTFNDYGTAIVNGATKAGKKYYVDIVQAAAYALAGTYVATGGTADIDTFDITALTNALFTQVTLAGIKSSDATLAAVRNAIQTGLGAAIVGYNVLGGGGVSTLDAQGNTIELFAYNNGTALPVTDVLGN